MGRKSHTWVPLRLTLFWVRSGGDCRGRRPGIFDAVHELRPVRSEVVVKLGARRAASLTWLRGRDTHALFSPCVMRPMGVCRLWVGLVSSEPTGQAVSCCGSCFMRSINSDSMHGSPLSTVDFLSICLYWSKHVIRGPLTFLSWRNPRNTVPVLFPLSKTSCSHLIMQNIIRQIAIMRTYPANRVNIAVSINGTWWSWLCRTYYARSQSCEHILRIMLILP